MAQFIRHYGTQAQCYRALYCTRWPKGFRYPACQNRSRLRCAGRIYYQPCVCRHQTTLVSGTVFEGTKRPPITCLITWFLALHLLISTKTNLSALEFRRHLGVRYRTVWRLRHKVMQTDGLACFMRVVDLNHARTVLDTEGDCVVTQVKGVYWGNVMLSNVKREISRCYHAIKHTKYAKYVQRHLTEATYRFKSAFSPCPNATSITVRDGPVRVLSRAAFEGGDRLSWRRGWVNQGFLWG